MNKNENIGFFEKNLTWWVIICMVLGTLLGNFFPSIGEFLNKFEYERISIPIAILIWLIIYPMMLKIDFYSIIDATKNIKGLTITCVTNWLIKPFTMFLICYLFFNYIFSAIIPKELAREYLAGAVILGAAPCTAMVFVWSKLTKGNTAYTLVQVAINDLILLVAFVPIVGILLGVGDFVIPYGTLVLSVLIFVVTPLLGAFVTRAVLVKKKGLEYFNEVFIPKFDKSTMTGLLLTLVIIFIFQGEKIINYPLHIVLIAIPLIIQTYLIFVIAYKWGKKWNLSHDIAAPGALIGASNFFELAVAVAIGLFGLNSGATLATVVGVLVEVPLMLALVNIANKSRDEFAVNNV